MLVGRYSYQGGFQSRKRKSNSSRNRKKNYFSLTMAIEDEEPDQGKDNPGEIEGGSKA